MSEPRVSSTGMRHGPATLMLVTTLLSSLASAQSSPRAGVADLSLEELANIEVTSVSRRDESIADAAAAIFVLTAEDIRRSGVTTVTEALRLAPNLQVAQLDAGQYAISARGFNNVIGNKLLVLIDGRTIYTPIFSGVFWDQQAVLLEDVDRIEVISGPGAALWGANAVNGIINIITRSARDTQGTLASVTIGNREQSAAVRYGLAVGALTHVRVYGKVVNFEHTRRADDTAVLDGLGRVMAGFRSDWNHDRTTFTLRGDAQGARSEDRGTVAGFALGRAELTGMNLLANWSLRLDERSALRLQAYYDHTQRDERILFQPRADLLDIELQHSIARGGHRVVWGAEYRHGRDDVRDGILVGFRPTGRSLDWMNLYVQDDVRLRDGLDLTAGMRFGRNDFTGWEFQPDLRLAWKPTAETLLWSAVSRAVRAPARLDRDVITPIGGAVIGGPDFVSEVANVFQLGYRARTGGVLTWSVTGFHHAWDKLRSGTAVPVQIENRIEGPVYGLEAWGTWQAMGNLRVSGGLMVLRKNLRLEPGSTDPVGVGNPQLANDPGEQWLLRSSFTPWTDHDIDITARYVAALPTPAVPSYTAVDARYAWLLHRHFEVSVLGQNLFDPHPEFGAAPGRSEFGRGIILRATWRQ